MWLFWLFALFPIAVGAFLWWKDEEVVWQEWLIGSGVALLTALIFQLTATMGMTHDIETWSGYGTQARQFSKWKEYYEYAVYRTEYYYVTVDDYTTDKKGNKRKSGSHRERKSKQVFDHWEPTSRWHNASWTLYTTIGPYDITLDHFLSLCNKFDDNHPVPGDRTTSEHNSRMIGGDPNDYVADNKTGWVEPVTTTKSFENRIKAAPTVFSYVKVPTNINVFSWPENRNPFHSDRVLGLAKSSISTLKWDQLNAELGASKKVNLIIVGFTNDASIAQWQEAAWIGGKKNDLVICYGAEDKNKKADWSKVFGWTEREIVKKNIQTLLLEYPVNNDIIPLIKDEVIKNYIIKDWKKFDYITIDPPTWSYWVYFFVVLGTQGGLYWFFHQNEFNKSESGKYYSRGYGW